MKIKSLDALSTQLNIHLDELDYALIAKQEDFDCVALKNQTRFLLENARTEIWENATSLDSLLLQYAFLVRKYIVIRQKINRCRKTIYALRREVGKDNALSLYINELSFLSYTESELDYILSEIKDTLTISPLHRNEIEQNQMITTLKDLFKIEEDYYNVLAFLEKEGKIHKKDNGLVWKDKQKGYKYELTSLCSMLYERGFLVIKEYNPLFMQKVISNTFNIDISIKTIDLYKFHSLSFHSDFPQSLLNEYTANV